MTDSFIQRGNGSVGFVGPDAVALYRARVIASGLKLYVASGGRIIANRSFTPTNMLRAASEITGKHYKRGQYAIAAADLKEWADTMEIALPVVGSN